MTVPARNIAGILGVKAETIGELDLLVRKGLPKRSLERTLHAVFPDAGQSRQLQSQVIPLATWKRRKAKLSTTESERTERLARVAAIATEVWNGDLEAAREWLTTPHWELGNLSPIEAALTEIGARRVEMTLSKLFYGLPA